MALWLIEHPVSYFMVPDISKKKQVIYVKTLGAHFHDNFNFPKNIYPNHYLLECSRKWQWLIDNLHNPSRDIL